MAFTTVAFNDDSNMNSGSSRENNMNQSDVEMTESLETIPSKTMYKYPNHNANDSITEYKNVVHKEHMNGTLLLSSREIMYHIPNTNNNNNNNTFNTINTIVKFEWKDVTKHQVSPIKYPKALLKIVLSSSSSMTFQMENRIVLESIRKDITNRLHDQREGGNNSTNNKKRPHSNISTNRTTNGTNKLSSSSTAAATAGLDFSQLDKTALAVTRAALLSSNEALRQQHKYLVLDSQTITEDDFWMTHKHLLQDEYARINGITKPGTSSVLQAHLPNTGRVTLGVQEMRQIFILYPAVHRAYEEKVPLELSDEQFWKKYLESEYFHRDRGRIGTLARNLGYNNTINSSTVNTDDKNKKKQDNNKSGAPTIEQQDARAAAVGSDDIFSRYDQKLKEEASSAGMDKGGMDTSAVVPDDPSNIYNGKHRKWGTKLAVGQFDLASTIETERGTLLEGPKDNYPHNPNDDGKGARVIQKYNRHWAMVLYPDDAVAGSNLLQVARRSVHDTMRTDEDDDNDAAVLGGVDTEMRRLVDFANTNEQDANHASGFGKQYEDDTYEPLTLRNIEAYYSPATGQESSSSRIPTVTRERYNEYAKIMSTRAKSLVGKMLSTTGDNSNAPTKIPPRLPEACFPPPSLGRELLSALTKKMAKDSETEAQSLEMANKLPTDLRNQLQSYFRRSSELLRHFFGLRRLFATENGNITSGTIDVSVSNELTSQKLAKIVGGMNTLYREMENMRKTILSTQSETDEMMRKMCLPIMDQLDWAFKLYYRENNQNVGTSGGGSSGGFVTVEQI